MIEIEILKDIYKAWNMLKKGDNISDYQELELDKGVYRMDVLKTCDNKQIIRLWRIGK